MRAPALTPISTLPLRADPPATGWLTNRRTLFFLLLLTLISGLLRFAWIDRPALWGDEGATFWRTCGNWTWLFRNLQSSGFAPLHYELYVLLQRYTSLSPAVMRFAPALCATLMVPAIYFLAAQVVTRRAALVASVITSCSAYLWIYAHDAKMYAEFWLFCSLHIGCLLWWMNSRRRIAWLAWIATGLAMTGLHALGVALLPLELIFLLTHRRLHWTSPILFVIGMAIIGLGLAGYYVGFNRWNELINEQGSQASGLNWNDSYNAGRTGPDLVKSSTCAFLTGWEMPREQPLWEKFSAEREAAMEKFKLRRVAERDEVTSWAGDALAIVFWLTLGLAAAGLMPWSAALRNAGGNDAPQPWWRAAAWLGGWLLLPTYFFYCTAMRDFSPPQTWVHTLGNYFAGGSSPQQRWDIFLAAVALLAGLCFVWVGFRLVLAIVLPIFALATWIIPPEACEINTSAPGWSILFACLRAASLAIVPALAFYYCAPNWRLRLARLMQFSLLCAGLMLGATAIYRVVSAIQREPHSVWEPRYLGAMWAPLIIVISASIMRLPHRALRAFAVSFLLLSNLVIGLCWLRLSSEPPVDRVVADFVAVQKSQGAARVYLTSMSGGPTPGDGGVATQVGRYYMSVATGKRIKPYEGLVPLTEYFPALNDPADMTALGVVGQQSNVTRLFIWQQKDGEMVDLADTFLTKLGPGWKLEKQEVFQTWDHWKWHPIRAFIRRVYVRTLQ